MSNDVHLEADFTLNIPHIEADFTENEQPDIQADLIIKVSPEKVSQLENDLNYQTKTQVDEAISEIAIDIGEQLNAKADKTTVEELSETVINNYNTLDNRIDTHISDKTNPHEVTKTQVGLSNVDNTSDLNKPISTATQTALNGKQNTISDLSDIRSNASNGDTAYNTIQGYGDIVTYNASDFATSVQGELADTALQPNDDISELNNNVGYITSASLPTVNNSTITFQKNNVTVGDFNLNQSNNETINISVPTQASDINALPDTTTIEDLTTTAQQNAINSGATTTNIGQIATNTSNISSLSNTVTNNYNTLDGRITSEVSTLNTAIGTETTNRQNADNNLQSQIDAIVSSSDVFDIVGTYAELQAYDISTVPVNDIIKVLVDSTHNSAATYYRCVENGGVKSWSYIGAEGAYYTKSESDSLFVEQTTTVNGKALSNNITLTASDVGALPSSTTIGSGILTIQNNGADVDTFNANATSNKSINIVTPTKTSDLTNDSGYIAGITSSDVTTALGYTPYNSTNPNGYMPTMPKIGSSTDLLNLEQGIYPVDGVDNPGLPSTSRMYGTLIQYDGKFRTQLLIAGFAAGSSSITGVYNRRYLTSTSSFTDWEKLGVGTVKSVNNTSPDDNGDVSLTIPTVNNGTLTITQNGTTVGTFSANQSGNDTIPLTDTTYTTFTGADSVTGGTSGLVPAPVAGDNDKYLCGDGTFKAISGGGTVDQTYDPTSVNAQSGVAVAEAISTKQNTLVSGTNIKTVNGNSLLGSSDITVANTSLSNVTPTSTFKTTSVSWAMPNYSAGVTKTNNTLYTAANDCFVIARNNRGGSGSLLNASSLRIYDSNDNEVAYAANISPATTGNATAALFVPKGYKYQSSHNTGTMYLTEYPLKGV